MKTIQFILSLMVVGLLASCSADSDVLNEMEEHNQLPNDEYVTVSLDLSAGLTTRATEESNLLEGEDAINSCIVKVFGDQGVLLATLTGTGAEVSNKTLNIKKQALKIYAIANFSHDDFANATTIKACEEFLSNPIFGSTPASYLPKSGSVTVAATACGVETHMVPLTQLTARIAEPTIEGAYSLVSLQIGENIVTKFPYYVYPGDYTLSLIAKSNLDSKNYSFKNGEAITFAANTIYKPTLTPKDPATPAGLWIDWYVAPMLEKNINASVGEN